MDKLTVSEQAYKNGYAAGYEDGRSSMLRPRIHEGSPDLRAKLIDILNRTFHLQREVAGEISPVDTADFLMANGAEIRNCPADCKNCWKTMLVNPEDAKARWIKRHNERKCSKCEFIYYNSTDDFNFCPNCGRKMY